MTTANVASIEEILSRYPQRFRPERIDVLGGGFSGAIIRRVRCPAGDFCLRGWPPGQLPTRRILGLHALLRHVYERGVRHVSVPVTSHDGSTLVEMSGRRWQLEPWMPGRADF